MRTPKPGAVTSSPDLFIHPHGAVLEAEGNQFLTSEQSEPIGEERQ